MGYDSGEKKCGLQNKPLFLYTRRRSKEHPAHQVSAVIHPPKRDASYARTSPVATKNYDTDI